MARAASKDGFISGYKAVPSLAQIKQRHQEKSSSVDKGKENVASPTSNGKDEGQKKEPDNKEVAQVPSAEKAVEVKKATHPLRHSW
jgi:hypothetical protein